MRKQTFQIAPDSQRVIGNPAQFVKHPIKFFLSYTRNNSYYVLVKRFDEQNNEHLYSKIRVPASIFLQVYEKMKKLIAKMNSGLELELQKKLDAQTLLCIFRQYNL